MNKQEKYLIFAILCCLFSAFCFKCYSDSNLFLHLIGGICWSISGILELYRYFREQRW